MASTTTLPPPDHIVISIGVTIPTSAQQAAPTVVLSGPTTGQRQDASVQTHVDEAPPLSSPQPVQEIVPAHPEILELGAQSEARPEAEPGRTVVLGGPTTGQQQDASVQTHVDEAPPLSSPQPVQEIVLAHRIIEELGAESEARPESEPQPEVHGAPEAANVDCFGKLKRSHWLRAAVLGAINGLLAPASVIIDTSFPKTSPNLFDKENLSSYLGIISGAATMAMGEYISIRTQLDTQQQRGPAERGSPNPLIAAFLSFVGYLLGALLITAPFHYLINLADVYYPYRVAEFGILVSLEFVVLGWLAAVVGRTTVSRSIIRHVVGGLFVTAVTVSCFVTLYFLHAYNEDK